MMCLHHSGLIGFLLAVAVGLLGATLVYLDLHIRRDLADRWGGAGPISFRVLMTLFFVFAAIFIALLLAVMPAWLACLLGAIGSDLAVLLTRGWWARFVAEAHALRDDHP